jgi:hypothetical protein
MGLAVSETGELGRGQEGESQGLRREVEIGFRNGPGCPAVGIWLLKDGKDESLSGIGLSP